MYDELVREIKGGKCTQCGSEYRAVEFVNIFGMGLYFKPKCLCAPRCRMCHRVLTVEYIAGYLIDDYYCPNCGWPANQKAYDKFSAGLGERRAAELKRQGYLMVVNKIGKLCSHCSKDLWYEEKAEIGECMKCGRLIPKDAT